MKSKNLKLINRQGFTLMEVIVSVGIIIAVLVTVINLIAFSISGIKLNKSKTIAFGLAQEGIEIVKNIRDNNWLHGCPACDRRATATWRTGLSDGNYRVQYNSEELMSHNPSNPIPLKSNSSGFYQYDSGSNTIFYRRINIQYVDDNQMKVTVFVNWREAGIDRELSSEVRFYNWLKEL